MKLNNQYHQIKFVALTKCVFLDGNPKNHDLPKIVASLRRHGFRSTPEFDGTLNKGAGGLVAGNGRIEALALMKNNKEEPPKGIATDDKGNWYVPLLFAFDAATEQLAMAYAIDHNSLTITGMSADDAAKIYDPGKLLKMMEAMGHETPVAVPEENLASFMRTLALREAIESGEKGSDDSGQGDDYDPNEPDESERYDVDNEEFLTTTRIIIVYEEEEVEVIKALVGLENMGARVIFDLKTLPIYKEMVGDGNG